MNNNLQQPMTNKGLNVGLSNIDVLKDTDISILGNKKGYDKSTYKITTHPDGTVTEEIKMNKKNSRGGLVDLSTQGVNIGDNALDVGISKEVSEDVVSFVDGIWGSRTAAGKTQDVRMERAKLEMFREERERQHQLDSQKRQNNQQLQNSARRV